MRRLFSIAAIALALLFASCAEEITNFRPLDYLTISNPNNIIGKEGGDVEIKYSIAEGSQTNVITIASCDADWVNSFDTTQPGVVVANVARNDSGTDRSATIVISLGAESETVYIVQTTTSNGGGGNNDGEQNQNNDHVIKKCLCRNLAT